MKTGDLDAGAPELRADSVYNRDNAFNNAAYGASSDVFSVMVKAPDDACVSNTTLRNVDALEAELRELPGVESTRSLAQLVRQLMVGMNEGSLKWCELPQNQAMIDNITAGAPRGLYHDACNLLILAAYLGNRKSETLSRLTHQVEQFAPLARLA